MNFPRYLLFLCGQVGLMTLLRFFFTWIIRYSEKPVVGLSEVGAAGASLGGAVGANLAATWDMTIRGSGRLEPLVDVFMIGVILLAFRLFDGVTDPIAGQISDVWKKRGHERRKLLWFAFLVPPAGMVISFLAGLQMGLSLRWMLLVIGMFVFFVGYTFYAIPYWSLIDDYAENPDQRRRLSNLLGVGMLGATAIGSVASGPAIDAYGFTQAAVIFAIPAGIMMILPFFAQPAAGPVSAAPSDAAEERKDEEAGLLSGFFAALKHRRFLATLFLFAASQMSFTVLTTGTVFIVEHVLGSGRPVRDNSLVLACFLGTALLAFVGVPFLSRRFGWEKSVVVASIGLGAVYAGTAFLGQGIVGSPMQTAFLLFAAGGPMAATILGLEGEAVTECARERGEGFTSMYFGVFNFVVKGLNGFALLISSTLVDWIKPENYGPSLARAFGPTAGGLLVLGVLAYFLLNPKQGQPPASPDSPPEGPSGPPAEAAPAVA
ncbi:MAG TPA: hypothetical protein DEA08_05640 [Planctomycetes bacterium]|nr:hypothetical protein [Planctomycetota bacterium]